MEKIISLLILLFICQIVGFSETENLDDLIFPQLIKADSERIYIVEKERIHIYSIKPFKKISTFGKLGEGPKEFRVHPGTPIMLSLINKKLIAATGGSIYYYDKRGKYIKEQKVQGQFMASVKPVGNNFIGLSYGNIEKKRYMKIILVNNQFKKIKDLDFTLDEKQSGQGLNFLAIPQHLYTSYASDNIHIYTSVSKDMSIKVFDKQGKQIRTISKKYKNLKISTDFKKKIINHYKTDPFLKQFYNYLSPISLPDYFPAIRDMRVSDNKIYVVTYKIKEDKSEVLIFNTNGVFIRTVYLPIKEQNVRLFYPYDIKNNHLYQTIETDEEIFELKITALK